MSELRLFWGCRIEQLNPSDIAGRLQNVHDPPPSLKTICASLINREYAGRIEMNETQQAIVAELVAKEESERDDYFEWESTSWQCHDENTDVCALIHRSFSLAAMKSFGLIPDELLALVPPIGKFIASDYDYDTEPFDRGGPLDKFLEEHKHQLDEAFPLDIVYMNVSPNHCLVPNYITNKNEFYLAIKPMLCKLDTEMYEIGSIVVNDEGGGGGGEGIGAAPSEEHLALFDAVIKEFGLQVLPLPREQEAKKGGKKKQRKNEKEEEEEWTAGEKECGPLFSALSSSPLCLPCTSSSSSSSSSFSSSSTSSSTATSKQKRDDDDVQHVHKQRLIAALSMSCYQECG